MGWNYRVIKEDGQDHLYIAEVFYDENGEVTNHSSHSWAVGKDRREIAAHLAQILQALSRPTLNAHPQHTGDGNGA